MDMADLAARTGLPVRKLRYVMDHRVLPGRRRVASGHGIPRTFTLFEGFGIALAARLLDSGLTRKLVAAVFDVACRPIGVLLEPTEVPLLRAYIAKAGILEIADGRYIRLRVPRRPGVASALDTAWLGTKPSRRAVNDYTPFVQIIIKLDELVSAIQRGNDTSRM
jgi:hypothetical protein